MDDKKDEAAVQFSDDALERAVDALHKVEAVWKAVNNLVLLKRAELMIEAMRKPQSTRGALPESPTELLMDIREVFK